MVLELETDLPGGDTELDHPLLTLLRLLAHLLRQQSDLEQFRSFYRDRKLRNSLHEEEGPEL